MFLNFKLNSLTVKCSDVRFVLVLARDVCTYSRFRWTVGENKQTEMHRQKEVEIVKKTKAGADVNCPMT